MVTIGLESSGNRITRSPLGSLYSVIPSTVPTFAIGSSAAQVGATPTSAISNAGQYLRNIVKSSGHLVFERDYQSAGNTQKWQGKAHGRRSVSFGTFCGRSGYKCKHPFPGAFPMWIRQCDLDANTDARSPIPTRIASNEEFVPPP